MLRLVLNRRLTNKSQDLGTSKDDISKDVKTGEFNIIDWNAYPEGVPRPKGPVRLIDGYEYEAARKAANAVNNKIRKTNKLKGKPVDVHEIKPVKVGGSQLTRLIK